MASYKSAVDAKCRDCTYDECAPGIWRQQVTLCAVKSCPLWLVRPRTTTPSPESTLSYYGVDLAEFQEMVRK